MSHYRLPLSQSSSFNIDKLIYVRIYKHLIEIVLLKGVNESQVKTVAWILNHTIGTLHVNTPMPDDSAKLKHILNITNETESNNIHYKNSEIIKTMSFLKIQDPWRARSCYRQRFNKNDPHILRQIS